jgi:hypothetical protein
MTQPPPKRPRATKASGKGKKAEELTAHIGRELRVMFEDVVSEPVPERFRDLLDELEQKKAK